MREMNEPIMIRTEWRVIKLDKINTQRIPSSDPSKEGSFLSPEGTNPR
jgi:hypothetical protein